MVEQNIFKLSKILEMVVFIQCIRPVFKSVTFNESGMKFRFVQMVWKSQVSTFTSAMFSQPNTLIK